MQMIHPSYKELISKINEDVEPGEEPVVTSRFSVVMATSKRARQIIAKNQELPPEEQIKKPLSEAVDELYDGRLKILPELPEDEQEKELDFGISSMTFDVVPEERRRIPPMRRKRTIPTPKRIWTIMIRMIITDRPQGNREVCDA